MHVQSNGGWLGGLLGGRLGGWLAGRPKPPPPPLAGAAPKVQIWLFWAFFGTLRIIILVKGHARAQIIACQASPSTRDTFHQFEITRKRDRITLINIIVFKSANIAVWGLFWHPPGHNLE